MNGTTTIDATLNPCSAAMDRQTYGARWLNVSWYGERLVRVHCTGITLDLYWGGWERPFYSRIRHCAAIFWPLGMIEWRMPTGR